MTTIISGLFDEAESARAAVADIKAAGIPDANISIIANDVERALSSHFDMSRRSDYSDDAGVGGGVGAAVGGLTGLLAGLGAIAIPGLGPIVGAGWLVATLAGAAGGAAVGGVVGGIVGQMTLSGIPEHEAEVYAEGVRRGATLVTVRAEDLAQSSEIDAVFRSHHMVDIDARGSAYREGGWTSFDENATPYTEKEISEERARYVKR